MSLYLNISENEYEQPVYRIVPYSRLIELFGNNENVLVHPSKWEDPYENFILKSKVKLTTGEIREFNFHEDIYGQCWSLHKASDAMWRIYSPEKNGIRIKTTIQKLLKSLYFGGAKRPDMSCTVGKVQYLSENKLNEFANGIYSGGAIVKDNLFKSLLVKRRAFAHEKEIRLLYFDLDKTVKENIFKFNINPHDLIDQLMIDPRLSFSEFTDLKNKIKQTTNFSGPIKRSLLYSAPEEIVLKDNKA